MNLVVAVLVGMAWIFISARPEMDYTEGEAEVVFFIYFVFVDFIKQTAT